MTLRQLVPLFSLFLASPVTARLSDITDLTELRAGKHNMWKALLLHQLPMETEHVTNICLVQNCHDTDHK